MFLYKVFNFVTVFVIISIGCVCGDPGSNVACEGDSCSAECFTSTDNLCLTNYEEILNNIISTDCRDACIEAQYPCRSYSYNSALEACYLSTETKNSNPSAYGEGDCTYYERSETCSPNCFMKPTEKTYLYGNNDREIVLTSRANCIEYCLKDSTCLSADYQETRNTCYLQCVNREMTPSRMRSASYYTYLEKDCGEVENPCYQKFLGRYFSSPNCEFLRSVTKEECLDACSNSDNCSTLNYLPEQKFCFLNKDIADSDNLLEQTNSIYFVKLPSCLSDAITEYECFDIENDRFLDEIYKTVDGLDESACVKLCLTVEDICRSVSYDEGTSKCHLSRYNKSTKPESYIVNSSYRYFEKQEVCKPDCYFKLVENTYLVGCNDKVVDNVDSWESCVELCAYENGLDDGEFFCHSAEYQKVLKRCYLSKSTEDTNPLGSRTSSSYSYFHRVCEKPSVIEPQCFKVYNNTHMAGYTEEILKDSTPKLCQESCLNKSYCKSALYAKVKKICYLNSDNKDSNDLRTNFYYIYYEATGYCPLPSK
ncbi:DgyrCDS12450 [Dimorphilus gyrociliatus]|uniref:DgyrCDS12450 n=1 Tax=Dimorphilus gyrociliatus TaxID=2664684 RepID=A0A7I8W6H9_9ANNE|nr:DgyrCDS12450 [Dimorphilus gyrociliatus]